MAKCKNCRNYDNKAKWCDIVEDSPHEDIERDCDCYDKMTNADRIRSMTDEELAEFLSYVKYDGIYYNEGMEYPIISEVWKDWLQSEVEE